MSASFEMDNVDAFVAGTVGEPGARTFFFQITNGGTLLSFKCEKLQVAALAEAVGKLLVDLPTEPAVPPPGELSVPVLAEWVVGSIGIGYEAESDRIVVVLEEVEVEGDDDGGRARFFLTRAQASGFAERTSALISGGRPTCVLCASPINPDGYTCFCFN
jgi:uncharacterized repeat protein (TIGR03847 family)